MEKDHPSKWYPTTFVMDFGPNELNSNHPADYLLNPNNWDNSMDQNDPFESALSSMVSSPTATTTNAAPDGYMIRELLGRLGSISSSGTGELSPQSCIGGNNNNSTNTSCYSTPLNSPPKLNLSSLIESRFGKNSPFPQPGNQLPIHPGLGPLKADPGFVERAARFSCFGNRNYAQLGNESEMGLRSMMPKSESGKLSRVSSNLSGSQQQMVGNNNQEKKLNNGGTSTPENMELGDSREGSSISDQNPVGEIGVKATGNESNSRKRKSVSSKAKATKDAPSPSPAKEDKDETNAKKRKEQEDGTTNKLEYNDSGEDTQKPNKETSKQPEPPKDYIHVRARRGQATDSHSLAERVRREKISERMKFLQDLVPGCNKVTGKAVVLDEIINYVQSLQRQVEFLSMKLATINPKMEVNMDDLLSNTKDIFQCLGGGSTTSQTMYPLEMSMPYLQNGSIPNGTDNHYFSSDHLGSSLQRNPSIHQLPSSLHGFADTMTAQMPTLWDDDLQTVVQMGFAQNQPQSFHGTTPTAQMKVEL